MPQINDASLQAARERLDAASRAQENAFAAFAAARAEQARAKRQSGIQSAAVRAADARYRAARDELIAARDATIAAKATLRERLAEVPSAEPAIAELDANVPIGLFPVRLETRFVRFADPRARDGLPPQVGELRVRIYPDAILADSHEPLLSAIEMQAGQDFWSTAWQSASQQDAWTALVAAVGAPRAAWIAQQCEPVNVAAFPRSATAAAAAPPPVFPQLQTRPINWHRAPGARLLPERWIVHAQPNRAVTADERLRYRVQSAPVAEPLALALGFTSDGVNDDRIEIAAGLRLDPDIQWTVDFQAAEAAGMAVRIALAEADFTNGFARVVAFGVKTSLTPQQSAQELEQVMEHHRVSRGLAFVPQGTPTNNTAEFSSGYPPPDPRASRSFRVERGPSLAVAGRDGARFAAALGLPSRLFAHVDGADRDEQGRARAMATALWPATMGYYLRQMLASALDVPEQPADLSDATIEALRRHFVELVRGRGPYPAFRIGDVPYGLLPVCRLSPNEDASAQSLEANLMRIVTDLQQTLGSLAARYAPRVGRTNDPDADLMDTFRMDASAREVYVRPAVGEETIDNAGGFAGVDERVHEPISLDALIELGAPGAAEGLTLKSLLSFPESEPDDVVERPPPGEGPRYG